jgi:acetyltransferase EpsM
MQRKLVIIGAGEHAQVVAEAAQSRPDLWSLAGFVDADPSATLSNIPSLPYLGCDRDLITLAADEEYWAVLGIGGLGSSNVRRRIVEMFAGSMVNWGSIIHSAAWISPTASVDEGAVILAGAMINANATLGQNCIINTGSVIEHDVRVGAWAIVSPGVTIGGGSVLGENSFVGLGAKIRDHITVSQDATVGMGAVVLKDVPPGCTVVGVPARTIGVTHV